MFRKCIMILAVLFILALPGCTAPSTVNEPVLKSEAVSADKTLQESKALPADEILYADKDLIPKTLSMLTGDDFKGRMAGTEGNEKAASYIADEFKSIGLKPFQGDNYYLEYTQDVYNPDKQIHSFIVEFGDGTSKEFKYAEDYITPVVVKEASLSLALASVVDGSIGEKAVILDNSSSLYNLEVKPKCAIVKTSSPLLYSISGYKDTVLITVTQKVYDELKSKAIKAVKINFKAVSDSVKAKNVVGRIPGKDNKKALIISAHFDHMGYTGKNIFYGAVDNASGVCTMLDLAERLKKQSDKNKFSGDILLCGFNGEEYSLKGSREFAEFIKDKYERISVINIDSVGKKDGGKLVVLGEGDKSKNLAGELTRYLDKYKISLGNPDDAPGGSDHISFNEIDIPGVTLGQTDMRGAYGIHTNNDVSKNVDVEYLRTLSNAVYEYVLYQEKTK